MAEVIPAILAKSEEDFKNQANLLNSLEDLISWVQIDVEDGKFVPYFSWADPQLAKEVLRKFNIEVHLMVENPLDEAKKWLQAGAKRIVPHYEALSPHLDFQNLLRLTLEHGSQLALAINPETLSEKIFPYLPALDVVVVMGVNPGKSSQKFQDKVLKKIEVLKSKSSQVKIEVDGGVNKETALKIVSAGADILVSHSFIFKAEDPKKSLIFLKNLK